MIILTLKFHGLGNSLAVQCLGLPAFTAKGAGSIPVGGTRTPGSCVAQPKKLKKFLKIKFHGLRMSLTEFCWW